MRRAIIVTAALVGLASCGGDDSESSNESGDLQPAGSVRAAEAMDGDHHPIGEAVDVGDARITISSPSVGGDDFGPWLEISVRIENPTDDVVAPFEFGIACTGNEEEGGTQADGTLPWNTEIPAKSFDEGTVHLLLPGDGRFGEARAPCAAPAVVTVDQTGVFMGDQPSALWAIDDSLIAAMNADTRMPPG